MESVAYDPETGEIPAPVHREIPRPPVSPFASRDGEAISDALAAAQGSFETPKRSREVSVRLSAGGSYSFKYAPLEAIHDAIRPALAKNGLSVQQYLAYRAGEPFVRTIIWHSSGEWRGSDYPIFPTKEGPQGFASGVTYARRYGLCLALSLAPEDDDDGNAAVGNTATPVVRPSRFPAPPPPPAPRAAARSRQGNGQAALDPRPFDDPLPEPPPPPPPEPAPPAPPEPVLDKAALKQKASKQLSMLRDAMISADLAGLNAILDSKDITDTIALVREAAETKEAAEATIKRLLGIADHRRLELQGPPAELEL